MNCAIAQFVVNAHSKNQGLLSGEFAPQSISLLPGIAPQQNQGVRETADLNLQRKTTNSFEKVVDLICCFRR